MAVNAIAMVDVISDPQEISKQESPAGRPFLRVKFEDGVIVDISLNLAEMIGGVARGAQERFGYTHTGRKH